MDGPQLRLRESPRVAVEGTARLELRAAGGSASGMVDARVLDLSITGVGLATQPALPKPAAGERCALRLEMEGVAIEGAGVVVWSRRARPDRSDAANVGVCFERLEGAGTTSVGTLVERVLARSGRPRSPPVFGDQIVAERAPAEPIEPTAPEAVEVPP